MGIIVAYGEDGPVWGQPDPQCTASGVLGQHLTDKSVGVHGPSARPLASHAALGGITKLTYHVVLYVVRRDGLRGRTLALQTVMFVTSFLTKQDPDGTLAHHVIRIT